MNRRGTTSPPMLSFALAFAGVAEAAKLSFSERGFVDVGALIQAQYRATQNGAGDGHDVSNDFLLRRARILVSGQYDEHIGFIINTDITYGAATIGGPTRLATLDSRGNLTKFSLNSQRNNRDVGFEVRGPLLADRIYYRIGIWNGVQTQAASGTTPGVNPGDAPRFAGMVRFNILGKKGGRQHLVRNLFRQDSDLQRGRLRRRGAQRRPRRGGEARLYLPFLRGRRVPEPAGGGGSGAVGGSSGQ